VTPVTRGGKATSKTHERAEVQRITRACTDAPMAARCSEIGAALHDRPALLAQQLAVAPPEIRRAAHVARVALDLVVRRHDEYCHETTMPAIVTAGIARAHQSLDYTLPSGTVTVFVTVPM
jgi:hypothetical protein